MNGDEFFSHLTSELHEIWQLCVFIFILCECVPTLGQKKVVLWVSGLVNKHYIVYKNQNFFFYVQLICTVNKYNTTYKIVLQAINKDSFCNTK